jgi:hypothetical protein
VARHPVAAFLAMVFAVNVAVALVPVLTRRDILPFDLALYESLGPIFGVALPAFIVVAAMHGRAGVLIVVFTRSRLSYKPKPVSQPADAALQGDEPLAHT